MFYFIIFLFCQGLLFLSVYSKHCNPANYICSGRCPDVPSEVKLVDDVPICMKEENGACICWLQSQNTHVDNFFLCEAAVNGSKSQISCQIPVHCFPPDPEPTCLVIPHCSCLLMDDDSSLSKFKTWKPVKALVNLSVTSGKYPDTIREFSLKHLLFLLGFVIAPLICWCLLNFYNEGKCKRKTSCTSNAPSSRRQANAAGRTEPSEEEPMCPSINSHSGQLPSAPPSTVFVTDGLSENGVSVCSVISSSGTKTECPPSYDEAVIHQPVEDDNDPPPAYEDAVQGRDGNVCQMWQTVLVIHPRPSENV